MRIIASDDQKNLTHARPAETGLRSLSEDRALTVGKAATSPANRRKLETPGAAPWKAGMLLLAAIILSGCTVLTYTAPSGEHFSRSSLGTTTAISSLSVESGSNGVRRVQLRGYQSEASQALSTITEAAIRAAITARP